MYRFKTLAACLVGCCMITQVLADDEPLPPETMEAPYIGEGTFNQEPAEGKLKDQTLRIKRTLLMVSDLERSLDFYENVIGLEVYSVDKMYQFDRGSMGHELFNTEYGTRRRIALLNTSTETRGIALREIDSEFSVSQSPRLSAVLFEASEILGIYERAGKAGATVIDPRLSSIAATDDFPGLRFMEFGVIDPDGHTLAFFKYFTEEDSAAWEDAKKRFQMETER